MKARFRTVLVCLGLSLTATFLWAGTVYASNDNAVDPAVRSKALSTFGGLPLHFVANSGQLHESIFYYAKSNGPTVFCTDSGLVLGFAEGNISLDFAGKGHIRPEARRELYGKVNYFIGNDPSLWRTGIPTFAEIAYPGVFPGIDVVYSGNQGSLKYTFYLAPGSDPGGIQMVYEGVDDVRVDVKTGELVIETAWGELRDAAPVAYQVIDGVRNAVEISFSVRNGKFVGFAVGDYNPDFTLILDPGYSTYLGGSNVDCAYGIAVDSSGNAYVTGYTKSSGFFTSVGAYQETFSGVSDAFVTKFSDSGTVVYSTYLGGSNADQAVTISVDSSGNAYIGGLTISSNLPTVNAYDTTLGGNTDAFMAKLSSSGGALLYCTYLGGGDRYEGIRGIKLYGTGSAYVVGSTNSDDFPAVNAYQGSYGGQTDAFVARIDTTKSGSASLTYSTYLGGSGLDEGYSIDVDALGCFYVTGYTESGNFPTLSPYQSIYGGQGDAFLTKFSSVGNTLVYSTYLGKAGGDLGTGIAVDASEDVYLVGYTDSDNFPVVNAYKGTLSGSFDSFVTKFSSSGTTLLYSTYLGGSDSDLGYGIAVDSSENAYVTGATSSNDFPVKGVHSGAISLSTTELSGLDFQGGISSVYPIPFGLPPLIDEYEIDYGGGQDCFAAKISSTQSGASSLVYSTYLGGDGMDQGWNIGLDGSGNVYIAGYTKSTDFPILNAHQSTSDATSGNVFVTNFTPVVNLTSPNGGEVWQGGSSKEITWETWGLGIDHIRLLYSTNGGSSYPIGNTIAVIPIADSDGTHTWSVPALNTDTARVRVAAEDSSDIVLAGDGSDGNFTIDSTAPETSSLPTGTPGKGGWFTSDVTVELSATDNLSGVMQTLYKVNGGGWTLYSSGGFTVTNSATVYYKSEDNVGNEETEKSQEIKIDKTAPPTPIVTDDGDYTGSETELHASWESVDPESGVAEFQYAIGDTQGGDNIVGWTSVGTDTEVTALGLTLTVGETYYFSVQAENNAGSVSGIGYSDGIEVISAVYVPDDHSTIQEAIDAADPGDIVIVRNNTYTGPGNVNLDFGGRAITVRSENGPGGCIIDCEDTPNTRGFYFHSGETSNSLVMGFTIQGGRAIGSSPNNAGGGIHCSSSSPTIRGNVITGNSATMGGGIACVSASPAIEGNIITGNTASSDGGGIYLSGSSATLKNNLITGNNGDFGGGFYCADSSSLTVVSNTIADNVSNTGGTYYYDGSSATLVNTILWNNGPQEVWFSGSGNPCSISISYSDIEGGQPGIVTNSNGTVTWGAGNMDADPLFASYSLSDFSPCIGAGIMDTGVPTTDIVGIARPTPSGSDPDIGAYENSRAEPGYILVTSPNGGETWRGGSSHDITWTSSGPGIDHVRIVYSTDSGINYPNTIKFSDPNDGAYEWTVPLLNSTTVRVKVIAEDSSNNELTSDASDADFTINSSPIIIYVPDDYSTIQAAIDAAIIDGDTVIVRDNTYTGPGNVNLDFDGKAITVRSENGPGSCIIDCQNISGTRGFYFHKNEGADSIVEGFTIRRGRAIGTWPGYAGGGIHCSSSSPTIRNNIITENTAELGGGIWCDHSSSAIVGNIITGNTASSSQTSADGGGIHFRHSSPTLKNNVIAGNSSELGAGIYSYNSSLTVVSNTIAGNTNARDSFYLGENSSATLIDTILWNDSLHEVWFMGSGTPCSISISYSDIKGGQSGIVTNSNGTVNWGVGNIDADPLFASYSLSDFSPCIGAGVMTSGVPTTDIVGTARPTPSGSDPDIGAYENSRAVPGYITLTSPNGGEVWRGGTSHDITWTSSGSGIHHIHIVYSTDSGSTYPHTIVSSTSNDGVYEWSVALENSTTVRVKVIAEDSSSNELISDASNANFTIDSSSIIIYVPDDHSTIQAAIDASLNGDTVIVRDNTYTGTGNVNLDFKGKAITVRSENGPEGCIIDCQNVSGTRGFHFHSGEGADSILDGFTIKNGAATASSFYYHGGGIYCSSSSPTIKNNIIMGNYAQLSGGGIRCQYGAAPLIMNNLIAGNSSDLVGGGIMCVVASPTMISNTIADNSSLEGGGIFCGWSASVTMTNTIVWNNTPQEIFFSDEGDPSSMSISYSDIKGGESGIVTNSNGTVDWGAGNIDADPLFASYSLSDFSPCIGAGVMDTGVPTTDIVGVTRPTPSGSDPDIGAYENSRSVPGYITLISPDGGEVWRGGFSEDITWTSSGSGIHHIHIVYSTDSGMTYPHTIISSTPNDGVYEWTVPLLNSTTVRVKVIAEDSSNRELTSDASNANFRIVTGPIVINVPDDYNTIQAAIDVAINGDTVIVRDDTYTGPGNVNLDFKGKAITVRSENGPEGCIIDCQNVPGTRGFYFHRGEGADSIVEGFTIRRGRAIGTWPGYAGGGIHCSSSSPTIRNNIITENTADLGGGIWCDHSSSAIEGNVITGNTASSSQTSADGGGIHFRYSSPTLKNNVITGNSSRLGGGIYSYDCSLTVVSNTIAGNTNARGSFYLGENSSAMLINTILWNDSPQEVWFMGSGSPCSISISYSDIKGGESGVVTNNNGTVSWGAGNLYDEDPQFASFSLSDFSPCIGAGVMTLDVPTTDILGTARPTPPVSHPDIGAYENSRAEPIPLVPPEPIVIDDGEFTNSTTRLHAWWIVPSPAPKIAEYQYAIGTTEEGYDVLGWTPAGTNTEATAIGLSLSDGWTYYFSVRAKSTAGLLSEPGSSDGITVNIGLEQRQVSLYQGWNLISVCLEMANPDIQSVLSPIKGLYRSVWAYDAASRLWKQYTPSGPPASLYTINAGMGYWIDMIDDATLPITGYNIVNTTVPLYEGLNLVGYNSTVSKPRADAMASIAGGYSIWAYDGQMKQWSGYSTYAPQFLNTLNELVPNMGFWILVGQYEEWILSP